MTREYFKNLFIVNLHLGESIGHSLKGMITAESNFYDLGGSSLNLLLTVVSLGDAKLNISTLDFMRAANMKELVEKCIKSQNKPVSLKLEPRPNMKIGIIVERDLEECSNLLAKCYFQKNILIKFIKNVTSENIYHFLEANWRFFVQKGLSFKVVGKEDKILGVSLNYERSDDSQLKKNDIRAMESIYELIGFVENGIM